MTNESRLPVIFDYVKANPMRTAAKIAEDLGLNYLTVQRQLSGGYKKISEGTFLRTKVTRTLEKGADGHARGSYCFLYFINSAKVEKVIEQPAKKKQVEHHPLFSLFGMVA